MTTDYFPRCQNFLLLSQTGPKLFRRFPITRKKFRPEFLTAKPKTPNFRIINKNFFHIFFFFIKIFSELSWLLLLVSLRVEFRPKQTKKIGKYRNSQKTRKTESFSSLLFLFSFEIKFNFVAPRSDFGDEETAAEGFPDTRAIDRRLRLIPV